MCPMTICNAIHSDLESEGISVCVFTGSVVDYMKFSTFVLRLLVITIEVLNFVFPEVSPDKELFVMPRFLPAMPPRCFSRWR